MVEEIFGFGGDASGMNDENGRKSIEVGRSGRHAQILEVIHLLKLLIDHEGWSRGLAHLLRGRAGAGHGEGRHQTQGGLGGAGHTCDGGGKLILELSLSLRREVGNGRFFVEEGDADSQVDVFSVDGLSGDAVEVRGVLGIGIGFGVEVDDAQVIPSEGLISFEEAVDFFHVKLEVVGHELGIPSGVIIDDDFGFAVLQFGKNFLGAFGEGVDFVLG